MPRPLGIAMNVPTLGGGGGGGLPESITDDFSADSGLWLDGDLVPAAMTVSSGRGIWTPTLGSELYATANAASDPAGNEADATTGWAVTGGSTVSSVADPHTGTYAIKGDSSAGAGSIRFNLSSSIGTWVLLSFAHKRGVTSGPYIQLPGAHWVAGTALQAAAIGTSYAEHLTTGRLLTATPQIQGGLEAINLEIFLDNVSFKPMTLASLIRWQRIYYVSEIAAKLRRTAYTQAGLIVGKDANNFVLAYLSRAEFALVKCVAGTYSAVLGTGAVTYSAGAVAQLTPNAAFTTFTGTYDSTAEFSDVAIADFAADVSGGKFLVPYYAGIFHTYDSSNLDNDAFDDFAAWKLGGAYPF